MIKMFSKLEMQFSRISYFTFPLKKFACHAFLALDRQRGEEKEGDAFVCQTRSKQREKERKGKRRGSEEKRKVKVSSFFFFFFKSRGSFYQAS